MELWGLKRNNMKKNLLYFFIFSLILFVFFVFFKSLNKSNVYVPNEVLNNIKSYTNFDKFSDLVIAHLNISISQKQELLETSSLLERLNLPLERDIPRKFIFDLRAEMTSVVTEFSHSSLVKNIFVDLFNNKDVFLINFFKSSTFPFPLLSVEISCEI